MEMTLFSRLLQNIPNIAAADSRQRILEMLAESTGPMTLATTRKRTITTTETTMTFTTKVTVNDQ